MSSTILGGILMLTAVGTAFADVPEAITVRDHINQVSPASQPQALPDIVVTRGGSNSQGFEEFHVTNTGGGATGQFHVAVVAGPQSYGFDISNLAPGQRNTYTLTFSDCGSPAVVVANVFNTVKVSSSNGESLVLAGTCLLDDGPALTPVSN